MNFGVFKTASYNWQKDFAVSNLISLQLLVMQVNGQWPINFGKYLPKYLSFLSKPLVILYSVFWSFMALHIAIFFFIAFLVKLNSENSTIPEMSSVFTQAIVFGFGCFTTVYFQWNHKKLAEMFNFVFKNFKLRSARGFIIILKNL